MLTVLFHQRKRSADSRNTKEVSVSVQWNRNNIKCSMCRLRLMYTPIKMKRIEKNDFNFKTRDMRILHSATQALKSQLPWIRSQRLNSWQRLFRPNSYIWDRNFTQVFKNLLNKFTIFTICESVMFVFRGTERMSTKMIIERDSGYDVRIIDLLNTANHM